MKTKLLRFVVMREDFQGKPKLLSFAFRKKGRFNLISKVKCLTQR